MRRTGNTFSRLLREQWGYVVGGRVWAGLAMAIVAGSGAVGYHVLSSGGVPGTANLWVDTNGGTCTRSATLVAYADASACDSLNGAYQAAALGDSVLVKAGSYAGQTIDDEPSKDTTGLAADVVFDEAPGESVSFTSITLGLGVDVNGGPDHLTLRNFAIMGATSCLGILSLTNSAELGDVTIDAVDMPCFQIFGAQNVQILNSDIGPLAISAPAGPGNSKIDGQVSGVTSNDNITIGPANVIHDIYFGPTCDDYGGPNDCHGEALFLITGTNITVKRNRFYECEIYCIFLQFAGGAPLEPTIENNWFGITRNAGATCCQSGPQRGTAVAFGSASMTLVLRGNSFASGEDLNDQGFAQSSSSRALGNIFGVTASCIANVVYTRNSWTAGTPCGTNGITMTPLPYVNTGSGAAGDYHLNSDSSAAENIWTENTGDSALSDDYDGQTRPVDANKDIGSDDH